jgi:signal transduction histidine kinase
MVCVFHFLLLIIQLSSTHKSPSEVQTAQFASRHNKIMAQTPRPSISHRAAPRKARWDLRLLRNSPFLRRLSRAIRDENVLLFLLAMRWMSLLPPLLAFYTRSQPYSALYGVFAIALLNNLALSIFHPRINAAVTRAPWLLGFDMMLAASFVARTGGTTSPYELYMFTPVLAASFFFGMRGGFLAAMCYTPMYLAALVHARDLFGPLAFNVQEALTEVLSFYLVAIVFAYPTVLLRRLRAATAQLQNAQQELNRVETLAAMGRMAAHLSHEIRNPLSTIGGFARGILKKSDDADKVRHHAAIIADEVQRLEELLTDMLDLTHSPVRERCATNIHDVLDKAWLLAGGGLTGASPVALRKKYNELPPIWADASSLLRAFLNVMRNALQFMPDGGVLTVETRCENGEVVVVITDTGPGIAPELLPSIWTPFVTHRERGTGLGLAVTREIVHQHGGRVEARSEEGKGAEFVFYLPLQSHEG